MMNCPNTMKITDSRQGLDKGTCNADQILDGYPGPRRGYRLGADENALTDLRGTRTGVLTHRQPL